MPHSRARSTGRASIYRVDPATGKSTVFFDLNTVIPQIDPDATTPGAANSRGAVQTGLVNWYEHHVRPRGVFRRPSRRCSFPRLTLDRTRPRTRSTGSRPDGTFLGRVHRRSRTTTLSAAEADLQPDLDPDPAGRAAEIPPGPDRRDRLGLARQRRVPAGGATDGRIERSPARPVPPVSTSSSVFGALFFDSNQYQPRDQRQRPPTWPPASSRRR